MVLSQANLHLHVGRLRFISPSLLDLTVIYSCYWYLVQLMEKVFFSEYSTLKAITGIQKRAFGVCAIPDLYFSNAANE